MEGKSLKLSTILFRLCAKVTHRFFCPTVTEADICEAFNKILGA